MRLPEAELSPEAHAAIVECLRMAARRGKQLRLDRERAVQAQQTEAVKPAEQSRLEAESNTESASCGAADR